MLLHRIAPISAVALAACLVLAGCSAPATTDATPAAAQGPQVLDEASPPASDQTPASDSPALTCDVVASAVAAYIDGLVAEAGNSADQEGAYCAWEAPAGTTDPSAIRSVGVSIERGAQTPLTADEVDQIGFETVPDTAITAAGGIAYTTAVGTSAAGVIVTTVTLPDVEVTVSGGQWDGYPALDGPAAVAVARSILGL
ncbi:hypothetical protein ACIQLJ_13320 [Microbacterium sp. NPDC091313]